MEKTHVIEYISSLYDGGAETLVKDYARLMDSERFSVSVVVNHHMPHTANTRLLQQLQVPIIPLYPRWNVFTKAWNLLFGKTVRPRRLLKILKKTRADVLHIHLDNLQYVKPIAGHLKNVRLLYTCHNLPERFLGESKQAEGDAARYLLAHNDLQMIALHDQMRQQINTMFGIDNTVVIRNGIDFTRFRDLAVTKEEKRRQLGIPQDAFVVGHVGRFCYQKNQEFLVDAFLETEKLNDKAYLLMVGSGESAACAEVLRQAGLVDRYQILRNRTDVNEILRAMDVFVFPSRFEGLGIVLIEAQVSGLRCVVSDCVPEEAIKEDTVVVLPLEDPNRWAQTILDSTARGQKRGSLGTYDMNLEIKRLEALYMGERHG